MFSVENYCETLFSSAVDSLLTHFAVKITSYCWLTAARHTAVVVTKCRLTPASDQKCLWCFSRHGTYKRNFHLWCLWERRLRTCDFTRIDLRRNSKNQTRLIAGEWNFLYLKEPSKYSKWQITVGRQSQAQNTRCHYMTPNVVVACSRCSKNNLNHIIFGRNKFRNLFSLI